MPAPKHRPQNPADATPQTGLTIDRLRRTIDNPVLDFPSKAMHAGVWWLQQLSLRVGDTWSSAKAHRKDRQTTGMLLCVAMDGAQGANDDLAPMLAELLRPYCPAPTFVEGWEKVRQLAPGSVRTAAAKLLRQPAG